MSRRPHPVLLRWNGDVFVPEPSFKARCGSDYEVGEVYPMLPVEERSQSSHNHYFAALAEAFHNLSEENAKHFPTIEHLRHWALIQCGFCTEANYVLSTVRIARDLARDVRKRSPYAVIRVEGNTVQVWDAESQSMAAMKKTKFEESKTAVLDLVASMARTTTSQLNKEAKRHGR
jgi:hypothetical protein